MYDDLTVEEFLAGPGCDEEDLDIDRIFGKKWNRVKEELLNYDPSGLDEDEEGLITPSDVVEGYSFIEVKSGLALKSPEGEIVGGYLSCDLCIDAAHQGLGLGAELVVEFYLRNGCLPTWYLDTPAYSPAGVAAHRSAWNILLYDKQMLEKKLVRINVEPDTVPAAKPGF